MSEIRFDMLHNNYVIIAPKREHRPHLLGEEPKNERAISHRCPFCEGNEAMTPPEIFAMRDNAPNQKKWRTRVIPNLYKAVQIETQNSSSREGFFEALGGFGAHEIIIDSPCHKCRISELDVIEIENWLRTMIIRIDDLKKDNRLIFANIFKNSASKAGATQEHPHTQIIALPVMPQERVEFLERNQQYYTLHGRGILEDIIFNEIRENTRVIQQQGDFVAYAPYASYFAFEVIIAPKQPLSSLERCSREALSDLSLLLKNVFSALHRELDGFAYNIALYNAPLNSNFSNEKYMEDMEKSFTFYLRITPRIYTLGGFELSCETAINAVSPENVAQLLRGDI